MSVKFTEFVWQVRGLTAGEKIVLLRIADRINHARRHDVAWPGIRSLARDCGLSRTGTQQILNRLLAAGYLRVVREHGGTRPRTYALDLNKLACVPLDRTQAIEPCVQPSRTQADEGSSEPCVPLHELVSNLEIPCVQAGWTKPECTQEPEEEPEERSNQLEAGKPVLIRTTSKNIRASRGDVFADQNSENQNPDARWRRVDAELARQEADPDYRRLVAAYAELMRHAMADANAERDTDAVLEHFDRRCRARGFVDWVHSLAAGEGMSEAYVGLERERHKFRSTLRRVAGKRPS